MLPIHFNTADGLQLHAVDTGPQGTGVPLLCLPGLTRNTRDFEPVFQTFGATRRVIALDFRGRGLSQWASDAKTYRPDVEAADTIALLDHLDIERAAILGSSRGGLVGLVLLATQPQRLAGLMLNDIGAVIEKDGLLRIADYVGRSFVFRDWDDAARRVERGSHGYHNVGPETWRQVARRVYGERNGRPCTEHDPGLAVNFPSREALQSQPAPELWAFTDLLGTLPSALLRGEGSDLLSADIARKMKERTPALEVTTVKDRGHLPFLDEAEAIEAIARWLDTTDACQAQLRVAKN